MFALLVAVSACKKSDTINENEVEYRTTFLTVTEPSFTLNGKVLAEYDEQTDQIVYSTTKQEYMVANLSFDKLYSLVLDSTPELNAKFNVDCSTIGLEDISFTGREMSVIKVEDNLVWLWDPQDCVGVLMSFE